MSLVNFILFLDHWQTLLGIIFGAIVAMLSFYLKDKYNNFHDRIEARRRVEVSLTRSLNDLYNTKKGLNEFLERITGVINQTKHDLADDTKYAFHETNLPIFRVYVDNTLAEIRTSSYYVHNKLLWIDSILEIMNSTLSELREDLNSLIRNNQFLVGLRPSPREQKNSYIANLESFKDLIRNDLIGKNFPSVFKILAEVKIYNSKMRGKKGYIRRWKHEGTSFKFFKWKKNIIEFNRDLSCVDRIDNMISKEVDDFLATKPR